VVYDELDYYRVNLFNDNLKTGTMTEEQANEKLSEIVKSMAELGTLGGEYLEGTPINMVFLGISTALICTGSNKDDDDMTKASVDLLEALAAVINSSRLMREIDIQNQINDLLE
jgi:hypothetical protein